MNWWIAALLLAQTATGPTRDDLERENEAYR